MARALLVTYQFPPTGGAGVGRALKLCKYLPRCGVETTILTVANPSVPVSDDSLSADIPPQTHVIRARTLEPGYAAKQAASAGGESAPSLKRALALTAKSLLVPDPQVLWQPGAALGLGRAMRTRPDVVVITAPPFSQFLLGPLVRLRRGVPLVLDYRDEWSTTRSAYENVGPLQKKAGALLERGLLRSAHRVVTATESFRENLLSQFPSLSPDKIVAIPNGYDPDDLDDPDSSGSSPPEDRLTLTYAGTIFRLTRPSGFLRAIQTLNSRHPGLARKLRVRFIGRIVESERAAFQGLEAGPAEISLLGYQPKGVATKAVRESHATLCLLDELEENRRIYPAKIFELMYLARSLELPCITVAPEGALATLAREHQVGPVHAPGDIEGMVELLRSMLERFAQGARPLSVSATGVEAYHRLEIARRFSDVFRELGVDLRGAAE